MRAGRAVAVWTAGALAVAVPLGPVVAALLAAFGDSPQWDHIAETVAGGYVATTVLLLVAGGGFATLAGIAAAWAVVAARFPGSGFLGWALALPLALPPYVAAYAWGSLTGERGVAMAVLVFATTLYPYVYLAARAAFAAQSVCALEAARTLGAGPVRRFFAVALPMARPAIVAGMALVGLEIVADFGAADHLGVASLSVGIFRAWFSMGDLAAAARLAAMALLVAGVLVWIERAARRGMVSGGSTRWRSLAQARPGGWRGWALTLACSGLLVVSLGVPVVHLAALAVAEGPPIRGLAGPAAATAVAAAVGGAFTLLVAMVALAAQSASGAAKGLTRLAMLSGYATPGAVLALGILAGVSLLGSGAGLLAGAGGIAALALAYAARFSGAAHEPLAAGFDKTTRAMREAATSLGAGPLRRFVAVEAPLAAPALFAAALIVAVEIAKELPATMILRPFGFDTLAVRAHAYAADERLGAAAWPALAIVALALLPSWLLSRGIETARAGAQASSAMPAGEPA